jgi:anti-sigma regulatory factor (Ser/Thr protein kinase)
VSATSPHEHDATDRRLQLRLERDLRAPALARAAVSGQLERIGVDELLSQTVVLLVSEVVSNAVRHSTGPAEAPIALASTVAEDGVRIAVSDAGAGFTPRPRDPRKIGGGYGLDLLEKAARSWGVEAAGETTVWFELDR